MTRWDVGLGGDPLRKLRDGRPRHCRIFGCKADVDFVCLRCDYMVELRDMNCVAIIHAGPTLRCRLFGCKPGGDEFFHLVITECGCGRPVHGVVHVGSCVRCGRSIIPPARIARR